MIIVNFNGCLYVSTGLSIVYNGGGYATLKLGSSLSIGGEVLRYLNRFLEGVS